MRTLISSLEGGLPHSEIHGSKGARPSPQLIAACHVLHRLLPSRHPSNALESLDRSSFMFMHGEDCAAIRRSRHTRPSRVNALDDVKVHPMPQLAALDAHGRTLNSRCHRPRRRRDRQRRNLFSPTCEPEIGGADRDRTDDLKLAKLPLSQLSYGPDPAIEQNRGGWPGQI